MRRERARKIRRPCLLLALEEELQVRGQRDLRGIAARRWPRAWRRSGPCRRSTSARRCAPRQAAGTGASAQANRRRPVLEHGRCAARARRAATSRRSRARPAGRRNARRRAACASRPGRASSPYDGNRRARRFEDRARRCRVSAASSTSSAAFVRMSAALGRDVRQRQQLAQFADDRGLVARHVACRRPQARRPRRLKQVTRPTTAAASTPATNRLMRMPYTSCRPCRVPNPGTSVAKPPSVTVLLPACD